MKNLILLSFLGILLFSCKTHENEPVAKIHGKVLSDDVQKVKFEWVMDSPFIVVPVSYTANTDSSGNFNIDIPVERLAYAKLRTGKFIHKIYLEPGDDFFIEIDADKINYKGKGAAKNIFAYELEKARLSDRYFYSEIKKGELTPKEFTDAMKAFKQQRIDFIDSYPKKEKLGKDFIDFFKITTDITYENIIRGYPGRYSYMNKIPFDSLDLPVIYKKIKTISYYMDDKKVISETYLRNLYQLVDQKAKNLMYSDTTYNWENARDIVLFDSLNGKTREYLIAKTFIKLLTYNKHDAALYKKFLDIATDSIPIKAVKESLNKYNEKCSLIGKPLRPEFTQTAVLDTANTELTFGQMMERYKGNVVYLDIWGLGCGPCRAAMPYSKKMKEKLKEYPIKFIYLTNDNTTKEDVWEKIFKLTSTRKNHYSLKNGIEAKFLNFMNINYVPCYMIFDKKGNLIDFNADRPTKMVETTETPLEKTLKELALKQE